MAVSLTPNDPADERYFDIAQGEPIVIGRASRSETKNLQGARDNALFDCPVISRRHAELKFHPYKPTHEQVTITDIDSMHGTYVNHNRLEAFTPFALRTGDEIQLGDRVTRGGDTHEGIVLSFTRHDNSYGASSFSNQYNPNNTFAVPSESEDESDMADDARSVISILDNEASSASTTPEQQKAMLGSQQQPIDIEKASSMREVINLDEDDEPEVMTTFNPAAANQPPNRPLRPMVRDESEEVRTTRTVIKDTYDNDEDEVESVCGYNTGLAQILSHESKIGEDDEDDEDDASIDSDFHSHEYDSEQLEHADNLSDSDASDLSGQYGRRGASDDEDGPEEMPSKEQASPELGEPLETERVQESIFVSPPVSRAQPASRTYQWPQDFAPMPPPHAPAFDPVPAQPRYDPVRGLNAPSQASSASQPRAQSPYTYAAPSAYGSFSGRPATDNFGSSRWDVQPTATTTSYQPGRFCAPQALYSASQAYQPPQSMTGPAPVPQYTSASQPSRITCDGRFNYSPNWNNASFPRAPVPVAAAKPRTDNSAPASDAVKSKLSIPAIVEQPKTAEKTHTAVARKLSDDTTAAMPDYPPPSACIPPTLIRKAAAGSKRKADDNAAAEDTWDPLSNEELLDLYAIGQSNMQVVAGASTEQPAAKKAKTVKTKETGALDVAKGVAKYAAAATAGGAGMVAFLASPYAQALLDWLA